MVDPHKSNKVLQACETFKAHLEKKVLNELCKHSFNSGVRGVEIRDKNDLFWLQRLVSAKDATAGDIDHLSNVIIPRDPSGQFINAYENFYNVLQKYRAVSELLAAVLQPDIFRKTFLHYSATISKAPLDIPTTSFLTFIAPSLAASLKAKSSIDREKFFAAQEDGFSQDEEVKKPPRSKSMQR